MNVPLTSFADTFGGEKSAAASLIRYKDDLFTDAQIVKSTFEYQKGYFFNFFEPVEDSQKKRACVIMLHPGGGSLESMQDWCMFFAKKGYVSISAEYKLDIGEFDLDKQVDAAINMWALYQYLRDNNDRFRIKLKKIIFGGNSAGAITALQTSLWWNDRFNPFFEDWTVPEKDNVFILATFTLSGATSKKEFIDSVKDETGEHIDLPNAFYHGTLDKTVPYSFAVDNYNKMISLGIKSRFVSFEGKDHKLESGDYIKADVCEWLFNVVDLNTPESEFITVKPS